MPIDVKCPECQCELEVPESAAGKKAKCPDCGARIPIPSPDDEAPAPAPKEAVRDRPGRDEPRHEDEIEERPRRRRRQDNDEEDEDDRPRRRRRRNGDGYGGDEGVSTLIPYKNGKALAAYYCGVFSLILCIAPVLGVLALVFGIQGARYAQAHPEARGAVHAWVGIILGGLTALVSWGSIIFAVGAAIFSSK
jgi:hypothetical protein